MRKSCKNSIYNNSRIVFVDYSKIVYINKREMYFVKVKIGDNRNIVERK